MMDLIRRILKQYWGYDSFRPLQRQAIESVLKNRDSVAVLPTGGGKSLCFQAPALAMDGMALVVSPLISLMKDQVDALTECGISSACIHSMLSAEERRTIAEDIRGGGLKLLYVSPERVVTEAFIEFLRATTISFVAIDEAHCISMWGHDFRPEYRALRTLKQAFSAQAVHAYTATATPQVREDIARELGLDQPDIHVGLFDRPNLIYAVQRRGNLLSQVRAVIDRHPGESGIIYCIRRNDVESLCQQLTGRGYKALPYHAGMGDAARKANQEAFRTEDADIIVATVAFGMGIDKSNVRYVIHTGMPKSLEHYQQESGRAGRDGLEADCVLLYSGGDFGLWKRIIGGAEEGFCTDVTCRHQALVQYFGQDLGKASCEACDVCLGQLDVVSDAREIARTILQAIVDLHENYGAAYIAQVLTGRRDERSERLRHDTQDSWNRLAQHGQRPVRDWIEQLVAQDYLERTGEYRVLQLTAAGRALYRGEDETVPRLLQPAAGTGAKPKASRASKESWEGVDRGLFEALRALRRGIAAERRVPAYVIFGDAALRDMARVRPSNTEVFLQVRGVGQRKAEQYAGQFLTVIAQYCTEQSLDTDVGIDAALHGKAAAQAALEFEYDPCLDHENAGEERFIEEPAAPSLRKKTDRRAAKEQAMVLFRQGASIQDVCERVQRRASTVAGYLADYLKENRIADPSPWLDAAVFERIQEASKTVGTERLRPLFDHFNGGISYDEIRLAVICLRYSYDGKS